MKRARVSVARKWWTATEVARVCGVHRTTAWRWLQRAETLRTGRTGRWLRVPSEALTELARSGSIPQLTAGWMNAEGSCGGTPLPPRPAR